MAMMHALVQRCFDLKWMVNQAGACCAGRVTDDHTRWATPEGHFTRHPRLGPAKIIAKGESGRALAVLALQPARRGATAQYKEKEAVRGDHSRRSAARDLGVRGKPSQRDGGGAVRGRGKELRLDSVRSFKAPRRDAELASKGGVLVGRSVGRSVVFKKVAVGGPAPTCGRRPAGFGVSRRWRWRPGRWRRS